MRVVSGVKGRETRRGDKVSPRERGGEGTLTSDNAALRGLTILAFALLALALAAAVFEVGTTFAGGGVGGNGAPRLNGSTMGVRSRVPAREEGEEEKNRVDEVEGMGAN